MPVHKLEKYSPRGSKDLPWILALASNKSGNQKVKAANMTMKNAVSYFNLKNYGFRVFRKDG
jgi:hypothetical protein